MSWWKKFVNKARGVFGGTQEPAESAGDTGGGCAHGDAIHLRQGTAEFEWFVARGEFEAGNNLAHGMSHLANLLVYDPAQPEWIELLEQYLAATPDPEVLIPRGEELYVATEALRAYLWQRQGQLDEAVKLLVSVTHAQSDARYLEAWALDWLEPPGVIESLPADTGLQLFSSVLSRFPEARRMTLTRLRHLRRWAKLSERFAPKSGSAGVGAMLRAGILRKAGLFDAAVAAAKASIAQAPDWHSYTALGLILREQGNVEPAEAAFRQAAALDAEDVSAMLEAGDMFAERQLWPRAIGWYEQVLAKQPGHPWAEPARLHCRW
jgi:tetratricopeptide (TPR) repeat protein